MEQPSQRSHLNGFLNRIMNQTEEAMKTSTIHSIMEIGIEIPLLIVLVPVIVPTLFCIALYQIVKVINLKMKIHGTPFIVDRPVLEGV